MVEKAGEDVTDCFIFDQNNRNGEEYRSKLLVAVGNIFMYESSRMMF